MPLDNPVKRRPLGKKPPSKRAKKIEVDLADEVKPEIGLPHLGDHKAPIVIVLDPVVHPWPFEHPIKNDDLQWLAPRLYEFAKLTKSNVQFLSASTSITFEQNGKDKEVTAHLKKDEAAFDAAILALQPALIVPMGARACRQIVGKAVQITKIRGSVIEDTAKFGKIPVLPLLSAFYARRHPENESLFCADLETLGRVVESGYSASATSARDDMQIEWCFDIKHLLNKPPKLLSVDVEGVGLNPFKPETKLLTVQLTHEAGKAVVIPIDYDAHENRHHRFIDWVDVCTQHSIGMRDRRTGRRRFPSTQREAHALYKKHILSQLRTLLENPKVGCIGQNLKFDWLYLYYKANIEIANYAGDTLLMAHLLDENMITKNIDDLARIFLPSYSGFNDLLNRDPEHQGKSRMDLLTPDKMLRYAGGDTIVAFALYNRLLVKIKEDPKLYSCYENTVMRGIRGFCHVELNGFPVDVNALRTFEKYLVKIQKSEKAWLLKQIPKSILDKWENNGVGLKPDRSSILIDYLYEHPDGLRLPVLVRTKTGIPSVSTKQAMPFYEAQYEFIRRLVNYTKNQKMLSTYVKGFYKYIVDGKIRPTFLLHITSTGRTSSKDPNGQNFPKRGDMAKIFRRIFRAQKGWIYGQNDLSQAELRIAAMISGDERMMQVYIDGGDIHRATAAGVMGLSIEQFFQQDATVQALKRYQAKAVNFGFLYGMWWKKFKDYAKTDYGVDFTDEEAEHIRTMFFETYPRLLQWHQQTERFVRKHKYVRAFNGRIRHLPMVDSPDESIAKQAIRQAINSPVQSFASDIGLMAIGLLMPYLKRTKMDRYIKVCGFIHDSIVYLVREDKAAVAARTIKKFMENIPFQKWFGWTPTVPIIADVELGRNLSDTYECKPRHYSKESGNRTYRQIERAIHREELEGTLASVEKAKKGKDEGKYDKAVKAANFSQKILGLPIEDYGPFREPAKGRVNKTRLRRLANRKEAEPTPSVAFKVRKNYIRTTPTERPTNGKAQTGQRNVRKIRRIPKAA